MSAHTPGPWELFEHSWCDSSIYGGQKNSTKICALSIYNVATKQNQQVLEREMDANARLIAAAPELLESLKLAVNPYLSFPDEVIDEIAPDWLFQAIAAIAKATGKESA